MWRNSGRITDALATPRGECSKNGGLQSLGVCASRLAFLLLLIALFAIPSFSQKNAGDIRGTVTDATGAALPGVAVIITNTDTGIAKTVTTNSVGLYDAVSLLPGPYSVRFSKKGFESLVRSGISLGVEAISVNAQLKLGTVAQEVVVTGDVAAINTENAEQNTTITVEQLTELPNNGADWTNMTKLLPGAVGSGAGVNINGTASFQSNFLIDGGNATLPASQNINRSTPLENIAEVQTISSNFNAEYGKGTSVFNVISKSGTNSFHGSAFEYVQNDFFNARNYFSPVVSKQRWNKFGGTIGGPIVRNKAFFYFSYERTPTVSYGVENLTVPTQAMRNGDFSALLPTTIIYDPLTTVGGQRTAFQGNIIPAARISAISKNIQAYIPLPNVPGAGLYNNYTAQVSYPWTGTMYNGRIDYQVTDNNRLSGSFTHNPGTYTSNDVRCPANCYTILDNQPSIQITDVWNHGSHLVNEFRASWVAYRDTATSPSAGGGITNKLGFNNAPEDVFPSVNLSNGLNGLGPGTVNREDEFTYTFSDSMTWTTGKHILKFGGEYDRMIFNATTWNSASSGNFNFNGSATLNPQGWTGGYSYADFLLGDVASWDVKIAPEVGEHARSGSLFLQDDYKLRSNLTLNFGLRYTILGGWSERQNNMANFNPTLVNPATGTLGAFSLAGKDGYPEALENTNYSGVQPRFGFAYALKPTWVIRGGYGIFDEIWGQNNYGNGNNFGVFGSTVGSRPATDYFTPVFNWQTNGAPAPTRLDRSTFTPASFNKVWTTYQPLNTPIPHVHQWSLSVDHELWKNYSAHVAYVGTHGANLAFTRDINAVPDDKLGTWQRPYPQFDVLYTNTNDGYSNYHSMQMSLNKKMSHNFAFDVIYNFSKSLDTGAASGWNWTAGIDNYQHGGPSLNYGRSPFDVPNMFKGDFTVQLPFGQGEQFLNHGGVLNAILGGWKASSYFSMQSGTPFTPEIGVNSWMSGTGYGNWRPNQIGSGKLAHPTINEWFDIADFVTPTQYTLGNSGRNILRGPHYRNLDFSMAKSFRLSERTQLQVKADAFNALNHANFGNPNASIGTEGAGKISSASAARTLQLGARLSF